MQEEISDMRGQLNLFSGNLNVISRLKEAMRESVRKCSLSREQIADEMLQIAKEAGIVSGRGTTISLANLDAWLAAGKTNLIPVIYLPLFCHVVCDLSVLSVLGAPLDADVIGRKDAKTLAWGKMEIQARSLQKRMDKLLTEINANATGTD